jgi:hypothetical protein
MRAIGYATDDYEPALHEAGADIVRSMSEVPAMLGVG